MEASSGDGWRDMAPEVAIDQEPVNEQDRRPVAPLVIPDRSRRQRNLADRSLFLL